MLLTARKLVQRKMLDVDADLRGTLRNFGLKVGVVGQAGFETRIREMVEGLPRIAAIVEPMLTIRRVMRQEFTRLHKMLLNVVRHDPICRQLMTAPGCRRCCCVDLPRDCRSAAALCSFQGGGCGTTSCPAAKPEPVPAPRWRLSKPDQCRFPAADDSVRPLTQTAIEKLPVCISPRSRHWASLAKPSICYSTAHLSASSDREPLLENRTWL
jgi:hypothetical protein